MITTGFPALDKITGGFTERQGYILHGDAQEAKTALSMGFLAHGKDDGRPVALVTERNIDAILEEASRYGFNLTDRIRSGGLLLFEYPANVANSSRHLSDDSRIIREFQNLVGKHGIDRLVLDPVTPLLIAQDARVATSRFQSIASSFSDLGATTIYLLDGAEYVPACRNAADGVLRLDTMGAGTGRIVFEQWANPPATQELEFGVVAGIGLVPVSRDQGQQAANAMRSMRQDRAPQPFRQERRTHFSIPQLPAAQSVGFYEKPRVLLLHPDGAQRTALVSMLKKHYMIVEAHGAIDGLASFSDALPDVVVLAQEMRGISGAAVVHKLRQSGHNMPVVLVGSKIRRLADQIALLQAGVDVCLEYPIDRQLLNLHVENLLRRTGRLKEPLNVDPVPTRRSQRQALNCTTDLELFCERALEEVKASMENGLPAPVFVMRYATGKPQLEELSSAALMVTRSSDLVYVGTRGIAVLLPEARAVEPFIARFAGSWTGGPPPSIEHPRLTETTALNEYLIDFIASFTGAGFSASPLGERVRTFGAAGNGPAV